MKTPSFLARTPIDSPNRSGFDMPFENMFDGECGTLYPIFVKECLPNETHSISMMFEAELPPMVSNFFGRVDLVFESFFCPNSLLWAGWESFAMHPTSNPLYPSGTPLALKPKNIPHISPTGINEDTANRYLGAGSLADFLGLKNFNPDGYPVSENRGSWNALPFLCYHRIYNDWYRNSIIQSPCFAPPRFGIFGTTTDSLPYAGTLPYVTGVSNNTVGDVADIKLSSFNDGLSGQNLIDGVSIMSLRQRNWNLDYFTASTPQPQAGGASTVTFNVSVDTTTGDGAGSVSIAAIRQSNAIQQWMERNNIVRYDYASQVYAQYGIYPDCRAMQKPIYLGRYIETIYNRSVFQTAPSSEDSSINPFSESLGNGVGVKFGSSGANGRGELFEKFTSSDHGFLMVMCSMRPHAYYSTGSSRMLHRREIGDIAFPLLSGVGDMAIRKRELFGDDREDGADVFGYIDQYADYKTCLDEVHGRLKDGEVLEPFVLQRSFSSVHGVELSSSFLEIPRNYMDQVRQVKKSVIPSDYWASVFFDYKKVSPLPVYSVPTLGDLRNAHTEYVKRGGATL